jgi:hypothetical protein
MVNPSHIKNLKRRGTMKRTGKTWLKKVLCGFQLAMLALVLTVALLIANITAAAYAQGLSNNPGWYHGMTSIAEQEVRTNEKKAVMDNRVKTAANITATTDFDIRCISDHEEKDLVEK